MGDIEVLAAISQKRTAWEAMANFKCHMNFSKKTDFSHANPGLEFQLYNFEGRLPEGYLPVARVFRAGTL